jgi:single-strand DNA-binding protein
MSHHLNDVHLIGRFGNSIEERELPSGTVITSFNVIIDRPSREVHGRIKVDSIACQTSRPSVASRVLKISPGELVEVSGALRRRFWRGGSGLASSTEVHVVRCRVIKSTSFASAGEVAVGSRP